MERVTQSDTMKVFFTIFSEKGAACLEEAEFNQPDKPEWFETE